MDYSSSKNIVLYDNQIKFYDEVLLIDVICSSLYDNQIKFVVSDEYCSDYGMDCRFDLPCLLEAFHNVIEGLRENHDFDIEFYEQGREYFFSFIVSGNNVEINVQYGYNDDLNMRYETSYDFIKKMFIAIYSSIFHYATQYINDISQNSAFVEWNNEIDRLQNEE